MADRGTLPKEADRSRILAVARCTRGGGVGTAQEEVRQAYTERRTRANAFDLRYAGDVTPKGDRWELCEKVLACHDVKQRLSRGWGERERKEAASA